MKKINTTKINILAKTHQYQYSNISSISSVKEFNKNEKRSQHKNSINEYDSKECDYDFN